MSCDPERVTGFVDEALAEVERIEIEAHLAECGDCREQAAFETALRGRLRDLAPMEMPAGLTRAVHRRLRPPSPARWVAAAVLPVAAVVALFVFWLRAAPPFVSWALARDHSSCFGRDKLPATVWSDDPGRVAAWFAESGLQIPLVPVSAGSIELRGARYCALMDRQVAHLYYSGDDVNLSLFVVPGSVRIGHTHKGQHLGQTVQLLRVGGTVVGVVSSSADAVEAVERSLTRTVARR